MKRVISVAISIFLIFGSGISLASTGPPVANTPNPSVPDVSNWNIVNVSRIELRISDCASIYLGLEAEYSNPSDPRDFVRVISRHLPLPISRCKDYSELLLSETVAMLYAQKEEQDLLTERSKKSDPFLYIQWHTAENSRTGRDVLTGDVNIWFLSLSGEWLSIKNEKVEVEFLTENIGNGTPHNVFSGRKYGVGDHHHIVRVDRRDIIRLLSEEK